MLMKKLEIKGFITGAAVILALMSTVPAFANVTKRQIDVVFSGVKIIIDGYQITPKDSAGRVIEPFIIDGTTYLPIRAIAEAFGKDVSWDVSTQTVYIGEVKAGVVGFDTLKPFNATSESRGFTDNISKISGGSNIVRGKEIPNSANAIGSVLVPGFGFSSAQDFTFAEYNTDGDYVKFIAQLAVSDKTSSDGSATISFLADGTLLEGHTLQKGDTLDVELNLIGVKTLRVEFSRKSGTAYPLVHDARFYPID